MLARNLLKSTHLSCFKMLSTPVSMRFISNPIDMEKRKKEKQDKAFQDDIKYFLSKDNFTLHDFHEKVRLGLKDKSTISTMMYGEDPEIKVLEGQNKVLSAMYDEEKRDTSLLTKTKKKEICEAAQVELADIKDVLTKHKQMNGFHKFLLKRRERGEPMPENNDELTDIYRYEKPSFLMPESKNEKYSKKQRVRFNYRRLT
ncbi:unnamed protein product [Moneuplotes crassus]|uniref:Uncharacterized protein n=1 Tax=Euplotes crassus TaxID=5936 RepID=A0AAD1XWM8_EUPCR|nr:unnamed protein product [Moneuplotes crassus]